MKNINLNTEILYTSKSSFIKELYHNFAIFRVENNKILLKVIFGLFLVFSIVLTYFVGVKAYAIAFDNNDISYSVNTINVPNWKKVADKQSSKEAMFYKVDLNNNDKILEELSYSDCIYKDDSNAWYCPIDCYQEELEHVNDINNKSKDSKDNNIVPSTPYVSHVSKILKKDYR